MDKSSDNSVGRRLARVVHRYDLNATDISIRLGAEYTALSHFHNGRRRTLPGGIEIAKYVALLEELTGDTAETLGLADLMQGVAA